MTAAAYDEKLLACEEVRVDKGSLSLHIKRSFSKHRLIIRDEDKPFVEYDRALLHFDHAAFFGDQHAALNCKPFNFNHASTLRNLTTHTLPEDVVGLIGSFLHDVHCSSCRLLSFNMTFLEKCRTALTLTQTEWGRVDDEVRQEGGSCSPSETLHNGRTLQTCMASPKANEVAVCEMGPRWWDNHRIKREESEIKKHEDTLEHRKLIKKKDEDHQELMKQTQDAIEQEHIKGLKDNLDMFKQHRVYLEQIFDGP